MRALPLTLALTAAATLGAARADAAPGDGPPKAIVVVLEGGAGQSTFDTDPARGAVAIGIDASYRLGRLELGAALERTAQITDDPRDLVLQQALAHVGFLPVCDERWAVSLRLLAGWGQGTRGGDALNPERSYGGLAAGPSITADWTPREWLTVGVEGRATMQLYAAENPFTTRSALVLLRAGAAF
jgi:hypothetical protein